mmetsp:Transcript_27709/g.49930  ORF Transcript_27709/g.49930 Transcript_27709/m.49930 type:complete len:436 (-) Transcript_27709:195-1502(-)|eukprot:CAMPEP_0201883694 /NCGR_PEP_ID=MMETSP0902-20130614/16183_1 /ASSEMBLY_ACC=CAM_ASM_000551 /TAXON_ID=420261 /ORGANISM="Thalassiosira antarctica, Strain CCMP982" /LENGTH=435 /DNA_ID=CAMNT_0048412545 /DNA_START=69 /DNA_END=1376 /DNA_ORIENTATION=+
MSESSSLASATARLEEHDAALTSIDLRGKGSHSGRLERSDAPVPRPKIRRFTAAFRHHHDHPPPSLQPSGSCQLTYLALHNHFLDPCELPFLFDALPSIPSLETLVLFHHDVGDEGVELLMQALTSTSNGGEINSDGRTNEKISHDDLAVSKTTENAWGLKELYLSHCNVSCKGASAIANALDHSSSASSTSGNKLKYLQVLSLGSNQIKERGALSLARAFGRYPSLQRMVLHGNQGIASSSPLSSHAKLERESKMSIFHHALIPTGWQGLSAIPTDHKSTQLTPTTLAMSIFAPLVLPHIQRRWEKDHVLVRPYDLLRQRLREEMYRKDSTFVDYNLLAMPDLFSWMGREGACCRQTSLHSRSFNLHGRGVCHSSGCEQCRACAIIHLNDLHELLMYMPHLIALFQSISIMCIKSNGNQLTGATPWQADQGEYL